MSDEENSALGLEFATTKELVEELKTRSVNTLFYIEQEEKENTYWVGWSGDIVRLYGIALLRIVPMVKKEYDDLMAEAEGKELE